MRDLPAQPPRLPHHACDDSVNSGDTSPNIYHDFHETRVPHLPSRSGFATPSTSSSKSSNRNLTNSTRHRCRLAHQRGCLQRDPSHSQPVLRLRIASGGGLTHSFHVSQEGSAVDSKLRIQIDTADLLFSMARGNHEREILVQSCHRCDSVMTRGGNWAGDPTGRGMTTLCAPPRYRQLNGLT